MTQSPGSRSQFLLMIYVLYGVLFSVKRCLRSCIASAAQLTSSVLSPSSTASSLPASSHHTRTHARAQYSPSSIFDSLIHPRMQSATPPSLLALPDACLLLIMRQLAKSDTPSLLTAAASHSRLCMAAREALSSITADMRLQKQADSIPLYLEKYGHHIDIINLHAEENNPLSLSLPGQLNLSSLLLANINLLSAQGLYPPTMGGTALKQLQLFKCSMLDEAVGIALLEAVSQLTKLESLSMSEVDFGNAPHIKDSLLVLPMGLLERFKHLTALRLNDMWIGTPEAATPVLQPLQALTASLVDLELQHLKHEGALRLTASMLAGAVRLTNLTLVGADHDQDDGGDDNDDDPDCADVCVEADILARRTVLQRLHLGFCRIVGGAAGVAQLLSHVKPLNQLTYLSFRGSLPEFHMDISPSAYSSITACSKLKILDLSVNTMPKCVWQHMLPAGRLVSNLVSLIIFNVYEPSGDYLPPPEGSRLVSCCPSLQELSVSGLYNVGLYNPEVLAALPKLTGLTRLSVEIEDDATTSEFVEAVCQFTRLRELDVFLPAGELPTALMQLTTLEALTSLSLDRNADTTISPVVTLTCEGPGGEPVWRKLANLFATHGGPQVAHEAAWAHH